MFLSHLKLQKNSKKTTPKPNKPFKKKIRLGFSESKLFFQRQKNNSFSTYIWMYQSLNFRQKLISTIKNKLKQNYKFIPIKLPRKTITRPQKEHKKTKNKRKRLTQTQF